MYPVSLAYNHHIVRSALIAAITQARVVFGSQPYCRPSAAQDRSRTSADSSNVQAQAPSTARIWRSLADASRSPATQFRNEFPAARAVSERFQESTHQGSVFHVA